MAKTQQPTIEQQILAYLAARDRGKKAYAAADEILEAIRSKLKVGKKVALPGGRVAELVDQFATRNKVYKPTGISRFELQISHE